MNFGNTLIRKFVINKSKTSTIKLKGNSIFYGAGKNNEKSVEIIENERLSRNYLKQTFQVKKRFFCIICDKLLKQPVLSNCGCRFCDKCYDQQFSLRSNKCPNKNCSKIEIKSKHQDRAIEREMEKFPISCINDNCKVDMYLSFLYTHLQYCPESLCYCKLCFSKILLKNKTEHEENECINRKIQCKFCLKEMSVYEAKYCHFNVVNISEYCEKDAGKCPYDCSPDIHESIKFHLIMKHSNICNYFNINNLEIGKRFSIYEKEIANQNENESVIDIISEIEEMGKNIKVKRYVGTRYIWKISGFTIHFKKAESNQQPFILSPPFYTEELGYKIYVKVYPFGDGIARGSHLSIFIAIAKGKYDPLLQWPFKHKFKLQILNQNTNKNHTECFRPDSDSPCYHRPSKDINVATGNPKFISFEKLFDNDDFIKDNNLYVNCELF